jgi:hypothetical protein
MFEVQEDQVSMAVVAPVNNCLHKKLKKDLILGISLVSCSGLRWYSVEMIEPLLIKVSS